MKKYLAEMFGTMVLVLMGCGVAVSLSCSNAPGAAATVIGTAMAFGLSVVAMGIHHWWYFRLPHQSGNHSRCVPQWSYEW
jgi:glycerol uptake facilitator-like aquaporin